jgi:hypothetical protein
MLDSANVTSKNAIKNRCDITEVAIAESSYHNKKSAFFVVQFKSMRKGVA